MIDRSIIELDAHVAAPKFYLLGCKVRAIGSDDVVGDAIMVYNARYEVYHRSGFSRFDRFGFYLLSEFIHHAQHIFFLMASSFKGSDHIKPPGRKRPSDGDCL